MAYLKVKSSFIDEISKNEFLRKKGVEYKESFKDGKSDEFLANNPDFIQMMINMSQDERIEVVYEDEDLP